MAERHQVLIVGGGPVGVGLGVELGLRGVDCVVVERRKEEAMRESEPMGEGARAQTAHSVSGRVLGVDRYEVVAQA